MKGAARNVDGFSIELEPLAASADSTLPKELQTPQDSCEGCPFTPRETHVHVLFTPVCAGVDFWHRRKEKSGVVVCQQTLGLGRNLAFAARDDHATNRVVVAVGAVGCQRRSQCRSILS